MPLTDRQLDELTEPLEVLFERFYQSVIEDMARRLARIDMSSTTAYQAARLHESGLLYDQLLERLSKLTGLTERELRRAFRKYGAKFTERDEKIYRKAGLVPAPLGQSPAMMNALAAGLHKTGMVAKNLTMTTALTTQQAFIDTADLAYMQVSTGAMSYQAAIREAVLSCAKRGLTVINFASGRQDQLDVAMRRTVLTGVSQTTGVMQLELAREMGCDLVEVDAHYGARNHGTGPMNHESWQGKIYSISGRDRRYPPLVETTGYGTVIGLYGVNCVTGDTKVSALGISAAYRRKYSGEIIVIHTAGGHKLSVTPNHPILTEHGWVAAGTLNHGDNIVSRSSFYRENSISPYINDAEPTIEEVFSALSQKWNMLRLPVSAGYFHGDISDGDIDVVLPYGFLDNRSNTSFDKHKFKLSLCNAAGASGLLFSNGTFDEVIVSSLHSADSIVSCFGQCKSIGRCHSVEPFCHSGGTVSRNRNSKFCKIFSNSSLRDTCFSGDLILPHTAVVHGKKFIGSNIEISPKVINPIAGSIDFVPMQAILDSLHGAIIGIRQFAHGTAAFKSFDNVVLIERKSFVGHVYNLQTAGEWYSSNGIITHNCRHSMYPFFEGISEPSYSKGELREMAERKVTYNGEELTYYDATQKQRAIERAIRKSKREAGALEAAGLDNTAERVRLGLHQAKMRDFIEQTGLVRDRFREQVPGVNVRGITGKTINALPVNPIRGQRKTPSIGSQPQKILNPSIDNIETYVDYTGNRHEVTAALTEINKVHRSLCHYKVPVIDDPGLPALGSMKSINKEPISIMLNPTGKRPMMTTIHETGHFIDIAGIDKIGEMAEDKTNGVLSDWWLAITKSNAYNELVRVKNAGGVINSQWAVKPDHVAYCLEPCELWARSYAQYIATKSSNQILKNELSVALSEQLARQWQPDDFLEIEKAFDKLFKSWGWLNGH